MFKLSSRDTTCRSVARAWFRPRVLPRYFHLPLFLVLTSLSLPFCLLFTLDWTTLFLTVNTRTISEIQLLTKISWKTYFSARPRRVEFFVVHEPSIEINRKSNYENKRSELVAICKTHRFQIFLFLYFSLEILKL